MVLEKETSAEKGEVSSETSVPKDGIGEAMALDPASMIDSHEEAKLLRRIDSYIISLLGALYLMCFLDRANIGSANVATPSISQSTGMTPEQYGAVVSVVYATYVIFEPIWGNLLKILSPNRILAATTFIWGGLTLSTAWAKTYTHLIVIRILLGVFEAGLFPCVAMYIMMNYRREEVARRISYVYTFGAFSGAVGGLLGFGLVRIESGNMVGWQYLYILEGSVSLLLCPICYFWIPNRMDAAWFLNDEQKKLASKRYEINKRYFDVDEKFSWSSVKKAITDWTVYAAGTIQFCGNITLYAITTFMPQIIKSMGFSNVMAQVLTVPVYFVAGTSFLVVALFSDKLRVRSPFLIFGFSLFLIGYIILATSASVAARYTALFIIAAGLYILPGINISWIGNNTSPHYKRASSIGLNQLMGNSAGAAIGSIYNGNLAPRFFRSMYISIGLTSLGLIMVTILASHWKRENKRREKLITEGAVDQPELHDKNPYFKYML